jgi:hypothetical protein
MNNFYFYFLVFYSASTVFTAISFIRLNQATDKKEEKITFLDFAILLISSFLGGLLFLHFAKHYFIVGMICASFMAVMFSFDLEGEAKENNLSLWQNFIPCAFCFFFWIQVICMNYFVFKRRGLSL